LAEARESSLFLRTNYILVRRLSAPAILLAKEARPGITLGSNGGLPESRGVAQGPFGFGGICGFSFTISDKKDRHPKWERNVKVQTGPEARVTFIYDGAVFLGRRFSDGRIDWTLP
jgi:hypothetical protein